MYILLIFQWGFFWVHPASSELTDWVPLGRDVETGSSRDARMDSLNLCLSHFPIRETDPTNNIN